MVQWYIGTLRKIFNDYVLFLEKNLYFCSHETSSDSSKFFSDYFKFF